MSPVGNRCGNIDYIPYTEHPWGPDYIPKFNIETLAFEDVRDPGSIYFDRNSSEMMNQWIAADQQHKLSLLGKSSSSNSNSNSNNYQLRGSTAGEVVFRKVLATNFDVLKKEIVLTEHEFESELEQAMAAAFPNSKVDLPGLSKYMRSSMNNGNYTLFTVLSVVGMLILITIVFIGLCICNHNFKSSKTTSFKSL